MSNTDTAACTFVLRNYPDDDALKNPDKYPKALSFSPDIIPRYGAKVDQSSLVHPANLRGFGGMPIVGGDVNNIHVRGYGSGGPWFAHVRAVPCELILWPQVWSSVAPVSCPVVIPGGKTSGPYASDGPVRFRPPYISGSKYSLVVSVSTDNALPKSINAPDVNSLLSFLYGDKSTTFYNVVVADPTLKHVSAITRLRMFGREPQPVRFAVKWFEGGLPAPEGVEVSLTDDLGRICLPRTKLSSLPDLRVKLDPSYDGILTLHVTSSHSGHFEPYSGLSLQVLVDSHRGDRRDPLSNQLLGALNVIFDPHSTRNIRFASPSATQLREIDPADDGAAGNEVCGPIPVTKPAATGWWFRATGTSQNSFPSTVGGGITTDVQPVGTDLTSPNLWNDLQDPNVDYAGNNKIQLVGNKDNYVFVRGHSTIAGIDVQSRIFAVSGTPLIHPTQWATSGISGKTFDGSGVVDEQTISVENANQFYLINRPFDIKNPADPSPSHYCIVAEVRQKYKGSPVYPSWPSEQVQDFTTLQDFENWVMSCPLVCFRNVTWTPCPPGRSSPWVWTCCTKLIIPECSFRCSFWTIIVECDNPVIPPGSTWSLTCDDNKLFPPNGLCFKDVPMNTCSPAYAGCHFTGAIPGNKPSNLTLAVSWRDGGKNIPPPSVRIRLTTTEVIGTSPVEHLTQDAPDGSEKWPFFVGPSYPYIGNGPNPSPLPTFAKAGPNAWPYAGAPQFVLGQVTIAAKFQ